MFSELNNSVWTKLGVSPIHGVGVFAIRDIPKGTKISTEDDVRLSKIYQMVEEDFMQIRQEIRDLILDRVIMGENIIFMSPNAFQRTQSFMNHQDPPNTDGRYTLRDIKQGEELTEDYRTLTTINPVSKKHYYFL